MISWNWIVIIGTNSRNEILLLGIDQESIQSFKTYPEVFMIYNYAMDYNLPYSYAVVVECGH